MNIDGITPLHHAGKDNDGEMVYCGNCCRAVKIEYQALRSNGSAARSPWPRLGRRRRPARWRISDSNGP